MYPNNPAYAMLRVMSEIEVSYEGGLRTRCVHGNLGKEIFTDAPKIFHGKEEYLSPTDLLAAAFGSCVLTVMGMQAGKLGVDLSGLKARVSKEMADASQRRIARLRIEVTSPNSFSQDIIEKLELAAMGCPVAKSLHPDIVIEHRFSWGSA